MIDFGPFESFQWPGSLYFTSFCWFWQILAHSGHWFWSIWLILMINFASFESFSWFILVHLDHFGNQVLSILLQVGTFWWLCYSIWFVSIHFDDSFWSIWIISVTKFSLFYLISLILDDFGTFCLSILVHFSSFWWFILVHLLLLLLTLKYFEWFWSIFIHFMIHFGPFASLWTTGLSLFLTIPFILSDFDPFSFILMLPFGPFHSFSFNLCN